MWGPTQSMREHVEILSIVPGTERILKNVSSPRRRERWWALRLKELDQILVLLVSGANYLNSLNPGSCLINAHTLSASLGWWEGPTEKRISSPSPTLLYPSLPRERHCLRWEKCNSERVSHLPQWRAGIWTRLMPKLTFFSPGTLCLWVMQSYWEPVSRGA